MTRYLLDTNILSNLIKPRPSAPLMDWMAEQADEDLFIASFTVAETRRGILEKPLGRKRDQLEAWFRGPTGPQSLFAGRVLPFDDIAALAWAKLMADGKARGHPRNGLGMLIAAISEAYGCVMVTDNERDFWGLTMFNPMRGSESASV